LGIAARLDIDQRIQDLKVSGLGPKRELQIADCKCR
jgi:hypothetical protein